MDITPTVEKEDFLNRYLNEDVTHQNSSADEVAATLLMGRLFLVIVEHLDVRNVHDMLIGQLALSLWDVALNLQGVSLNDGVTTYEYVKPHFLVLATGLLKQSRANYHSGTR